MFLRFSKGAYIKGTDKRKYTKSAFIGDDVLMEHDNDVVGYATKTDETDKTIVYTLWVAIQNELPHHKITRSIKDLIGKSNKFSSNPSTKRRRYMVVPVDKAAIPVRVGITINEK